MDCIFCKIANKDIPCGIVYEDDYVLAFLDVHPCSKGHTVLIPKQHFSDLASLPLIEWQNLALGIKNALEKISNILRPDGVNIGINDRSCAGQVVKHVHWHIMPRWENDGGGSVHSIIRNPGSQTVSEVAWLFQRQKE